MLLPITWFSDIYICLMHCLFIPGFAAPYWISYYVAADQDQRGLWQVSTKSPSISESFLPVLSPYSLAPNLLICKHYGNSVSYHAITYYMVL